MLHRSATGRRVRVHLSNPGLRLALAACLSVAAQTRGQAQRTIDFAEGAQNGQWLRHPVCGEVSYDSFVHSSVNPVHRGSSPFEWPVNGSLFRDPVGGGWYLYVGHYRANYAIDPPHPPHATVFRSLDQGRTWQDLGPVFRGPTPTYEGEISPTTHAPDVMVTYADGRYHMCLDWCTDSISWDNIFNPSREANSGVGYAWSDRPEGPFHMTARPIATARSQPLLIGKYRRLYISTLIRRQHDWLVLTDSDSGPHFGWALVGMTAERPEGPYGPAKLLLYPESTRFHPPLVEFNPGFAHDGFVYMPATSIAGNRDYQALFRAPLEQAMDPDAWELAQHGSLWHADPVEHETYGIWGQTFAGFISPEGVFNVFFPSRDSRGMGTVNLASRPWSEPLRRRGFVIAAHEVPSLCYLKTAGSLRRIEAELDRVGTASFLWNAEGILGAKAIEHPFAVHPRASCSCAALELAPREWRLVDVNAGAERRVVATGPLEASPTLRVAVAWKDAGQAELTVDGKAVWQGALPNGPGLMGMLCQPQSRAEVKQLTLTGEFGPGRVRYLCTDAIIGAARKATDWPVQQASRFRYGLGAVSAASAVDAKWNFEGTAITLWAPKSPAFGTADLILDGRNVGSMNFSADRDAPSRPVFEMQGLSPGQGHALILRTHEKPVPLDVLESTVELSAQTSRPAGPESSKP